MPFVLSLQIKRITALQKKSVTEIPILNAILILKIFYDSLAWHWNRDLNIYFQFQKKSKSHNFTEIKYLHSCQNETLSKYHRNQNLKFSQKYTKPRIQKRFYHQSWVLKVLKHYKIFFCKFLGNYKRKIVFPPERERKFGEDQNFWKSTGINNINIKDKEYINSSI